jgi:hypothetical protein
LVSASLGHPGSALSLRLHALGFARKKPSLFASAPKTNLLVAVHVLRPDLRQKHADALVAFAKENSHLPTAAGGGKGAGAGASAYSAALGALLDSFGPVPASTSASGATAAVVPFFSSPSNASAAAATKGAASPSSSSSSSSSVAGSVWQLLAATEVVWDMTGASSAGDKESSGVPGGVAHFAPLVLPGSVLDGHGAVDLHTPLLLQVLHVDPKKVLDAGAVFPIAVDASSASAAVDASSALSTSSSISGRPLPPPHATEELARVACTLGLLLARQHGTANTAAPLLSPRGGGGAPLPKSSGPCALFCPPSGPAVSKAAVNAGQNFALYATDVAVFLPQPPAHVVAAVSSSASAVAAAAAAAPNR